MQKYLPTEFKNWPNISEACFKIVLQACSKCSVQACYQNFHLTLRGCLLEKIGNLNRFVPEISGSIRAFRKTNVKPATRGEITSALTRHFYCYWSVCQKLLLIWDGVYYRFPYTLPYDLPWFLRCFAEIMEECLLIVLLYFTIHVIQFIYQLN